MCQMTDTKNSNAKVKSPKDKLKILSFNVENLLPKLDDPNFIALMNEYEICLFTETWLSNDDKIGLPQFFDIHFTRSKKLKHGRHSGGISAFIKKELRPGIKVVSKEEGFVWLKFDKTFFGLNNHLFISAIYLHRVLKVVLAFR